MRFAAKSPYHGKRDKPPGTKEFACFGAVGKIEKRSSSFTCKSKTGFSIPAIVFGFSDIPTKTEF